MRNRMLGFFDTGLEIGALTDAQKAIMKKAPTWYHRIRRCFHGDHYVPAGPRPQYVPIYEEDDNGECYQYVAREGDLSVVYFYRCLSKEDSFTARLRGLDPKAIHRTDFYRGAPERDFTGTELMEKGYTCRLENTRSADIMVLTRQQDTSVSATRG